MTRSRNIVKLALTFLATLSITNSAPALDLLVPGIYPTIQSAINSALPGDRIRIQTGTYSENLVLTGEDITIEALVENQQVVINGRQRGSVITFDGDESPNCLIQNVTLFNGKSALGGGIRGNFTLATLRNVEVRNNISTGLGGGIYGMSGWIDQCRIHSNQAVSGAGISTCEGVISFSTIQVNLASQNGGGISDSDARIYDCTIQGNQALTRGGGLYNCDGVIDRNLIQNNKVTAAGTQAIPASFGAGLSDCGGTVTANLIRANESNGNGGGMHGCDGVITNNRIVSNLARTGGGLANCDGTVDANTIAFNEAVFAGGGVNNSQVVMKNSIIWGNTAPAGSQVFGGQPATYSCVQFDPGTDPTNIALNPAFRNAGADDYRLKSTSPCIDEGMLLPHLVKDFEGQPRPIVGRAGPVGGDGSYYDMGADEHNPPTIDLATQSMAASVRYVRYQGNDYAQIGVQHIYRNQGNTPANGPFYNVFYLSDDAFFDAGDRVIGKYQAISSLGAGQFQKHSTSATIRSSSLAGKYLLGVLDKTGKVTEINLGNNVGVFGPLQ